MDLFYKLIAELIGDHKENEEYFCKAEDSDEERFRLQTKMKAPPIDDSAWLLFLQWGVLPFNFGMVLIFHGMAQVVPITVRYQISQRRLAFFLCSLLCPKS